MITFYSFVLSICYVELCCAIPKLLRVFRWIALLVAITGGMGLGCFSLATDYSRHFTFAASGIAGVLIFEAIDFLILAKKAEFAENAHRVAALAVQLASAFVFAAGRWMMSDRDYLTGTGVSEYVLLLSMGWFDATLCCRYRRIEFCVLIEE